jgi:hypothetical protein
LVGAAEGQSHILTGHNLVVMLCETIAKFDIIKPVGKLCNSK